MLRKFSAGLYLGFCSFACANSGSSVASGSPVTSISGASGSEPSATGGGGAAASVGGANHGAAGAGADAGSQALGGTADAEAGGAIDAGSEAGDSGTSLPNRVLLYHFSTLDIPSVPAQIAFLKTTLATLGFVADDSIDPSVITDDNLEGYAALAMINTCFEPFGMGKPDRPQSEVIQRFVQRGGGLFGTHCASVTFQSDSPPALYNQVLGGRGGNGFFEGMNACRVVSSHATTTALPATFAFNGNLDNTDFLAPDTVVLVKCTWQTSGGKDVAVSWYRQEGLGRVFYTDFAKVDTDLEDPVLGAKHILAGLSWVLGIRAP
jgi:hypothetical protein